MQWQDFNNGLGRLPVSVFINLEGTMNIFSFWDTIQELQCRDIIFYGNIYSNTNELRFLNSMLISHGFYVSIIYNCPKIPETVANSFIAFTDEIIMKKQLLQYLKNLTIEDVVVLSQPNMKIVRGIRQYFLGHGIKARLMNSVKTGLIENKLYDVIPYTGEINYEVR